LVKKGKIIDFEGTWGSGLATLIVEDEEGKIHEIPCDNAPTVRALESAFGNIISAGRTANIKNAKGKWIFYELTDWGTLAGFVPEELAPDELIEAYEKEKEEREKKKLKGIT